MSTAALVVIYVAMLVFDAVVLAGAAYLIGWRGWSAWWMLLAVFMAAGSSPKYIIATWRCANGGAA